MSIGVANWRVPGAMLLAGTAFLVACSATHTGSLLRPTSGTMLTDRTPVPPGQRFATMLAPVVPGTATSITLKSVRLTGTGIGTVAKVISVSAGPDRPAGQATPTTTFVTDPPVFSLGGQCLVQRLERLHDLVLHHGQDVRLYVVLEALKPGRFHNTGYRVTYAANGTTYTDDIPVGYTTWVRHGVPRRRPPPQERGCLSDSHLL